MIHSVKIAGSVSTLKCRQENKDLARVFSHHIENSTTQFDQRAPLPGGQFYPPFLNR